MGDYGHAVTPENTHCTPRSGRELVFPDACGWAVSAPAGGGHCPKQPRALPALPAARARLGESVWAAWMDAVLRLSMRSPGTEGSRHLSQRPTLHLAGGEQAGASCSAPLGLTASAGRAAHPRQGALQAASCTSPAALKPRALEYQYKGGPWKSPWRQEMGLSALPILLFPAVGGHLPLPGAHLPQSPDLPAPPSKDSA